MEAMMWEILVPARDNQGKKYPLDWHTIWDELVIEITGGLTISKPAKGKWVSPLGTKYYEHMIPCRIVCSEEEINRIVDLTMEHYDQEAVLAYRISSNVVLKYRTDSE